MPHRDSLREGLERLCAEIDRALERDEIAGGPEGEAALMAFADQVSVVLELLAEDPSAASAHDAMRLRVRLGDIQQRKMRAILR